MLSGRVKRESYAPFWLFLSFLASTPECLAEAEGTVQVAGVLTFPSQGLCNLGFQGFQVRVAGGQPSFLLLSQQFPESLEIFLDCAAIPA